MADCKFQLTGPTLLKKGEVGTYQLTPTPSGALCSVRWSINGRPAKAGDNYRDLHATQVGFEEIMARADADGTSGAVTATVSCKGEAECGPTDFTVVIGSPEPESHIGGTIVAIVLLPFIVVIGVGLLPLWVLLFIIDKATSDEAKKAKGVSRLWQRLGRWWREQF